MSNHTPTPWRVTENLSHPQGPAVRGTAPIAEHDHVANYRLAADAIRTVACVNALAGIETTSLENGVVADAFAALRELVEHLEQPSLQYIDPETLDRARTALTLVTPKE